MTSFEAAAKIAMDLALEAQAQATDAAIKARGVAIEAEEALGQARATLILAEAARDQCDKAEQSAIKTANAAVAVWQFAQAKTRS